MTTPGSVSEEAARLVAALEEQLRGTSGGLLGNLASMAGKHVGGSQVCTLCPLCQALNLLRSTRPEVVEHLLAASLELLAALRAAVDAGGRPTRRPTVERITIS